MNLPNKLTLIRIFMIPLFVAVFYLDVIPFNFCIAGAIFALAAFTDFLDGHIARKYNLVTDFGKFLDPIADKVLVSTALIVMLVPPTGAQILSAFAPAFIGAICVAIILARELIISGFRLVAANKGMVIAADKSGKIKTFATDVAILILLVSANLSGTAFTIVNIAGLVLFYLSTALTVYSGVECMVKNKGVISSK
jgi:CDP-diacylglycerol--glycerol-3-phosphate 3-phosphatidyltransferase